MNDRKAPKIKANALIPYGYRPELDVWEILWGDTTKYYNNIIVIMNCTVELGYVYIHNYTNHLS